jgi:hypothetical protein
VVVVEVDETGHRLPESAGGWLLSVRNGFHRMSASLMANNCAGSCRAVVRLCLSKGSLRPHARVCEHGKWRRNRYRPGSAAVAPLAINGRLMSGEN